MTTNFTLEQKLIEAMPVSGVLSGGKPTGREGFDVVVIERIGTGSRYYCTLAAGDLLRFSERLFGSFSAIVVDMRPARLLRIQADLPTLDPLIKVKIEAGILYHVTESRRVAIEIEDALAKFRDHILNILRRELGQMPHQKITEIHCERLVTSIGKVDYFGLAVEGITYLHLTHDSRVIKGLEDRSILDHNRGLGHDLDEDEYRRALRKQEQEQELARRRAQAELELQQSRIQSLNMADMNTMMHLHPELIGTIFNRLTERDQQEFTLRLGVEGESLKLKAQVIERYLQQNPDASSEDLMRMIREMLPPIAAKPRIEFGTLSPSSSQQSGRIQFGPVIDVTPSTAPPSSPSSTPPSGDSPDD